MQFTKCSFKLSLMLMRRNKKQWRFFSSANSKFQINGKGVGCGGLQKTKIIEKRW